MSASLSPSSVSVVVLPTEGFSWNLLNFQLADGNAVDQFMADTDEHYIMKADLQICTQEGMQQKVKNRTVMLTEESFVEMKCTDGTEPPSLPPATSQAIIANSKQKKHKSLLEIHSIELDPATKNGSAFRIAFFSGSAASKAKASFSKLARFLQVSSSFDDFLKVKIVRCHSAEECSQWMFVLDKLLRQIWQKKLESTLLPSPEIYKRHAFVIKQHNDRLLMLSDYWMYNVDVSYKPVELKQIKWAIPVSSLVSLSQFNDSDMAVMSISFDAAEAKKQFDSHHRNNKATELRNKLHEFIFRTKEERQRFVNSLAAVYWQVTRKKLTLLEGKQGGK